MATIVIDHAAKNAVSVSCKHEHRPAAHDTTPSKDVAILPVTVNGVAISRKAIAAEVQNFPARNPGDGWRTATRALVIRELLLQEANVWTFRSSRKPTRMGGSKHRTTRWCVPSSSARPRHR